MLTSCPRACGCQTSNLPLLPPGPPLFTLWVDFHFSTFCESFRQGPHLTNIKDIMFQELTGEHASKAGSGDGERGKAKTSIWIACLRNPEQEAALSDGILCRSVCKNHKPAPYSLLQPCHGFRGKLQTVPLLILSICLYPLLLPICIY